MRTLLSIEWGRGSTLLVSVYHRREVTASRRDATPCPREGQPRWPPRPRGGRVRWQACPRERIRRAVARGVSAARAVPAEQGGERTPRLGGMGGQAEAPERGGARGEEV